MQTLLKDTVILSRREFLAALFMPLFLGWGTAVAGPGVQEERRPGHEDEEFVILGGWVLLKEDLVERKD